MCRFQRGEGGPSWIFRQGDENNRVKESAARTSFGALLLQYIFLPPLAQETRFPFSIFIKASFFVFVSILGSASMWG